MGETGETLSPPETMLCFVQGFLIIPLEHIRSSNFQPNIYKFYL